MQKPSALVKGDKVAIISTARKISAEEIESAKKIIEQWGLEVVYGEHLFSSDHQFSGTTQERINDLQWALDNPNIRAVLCARGGYGTVKLIDEINFSTFKANPKWIVGYSDVTVLHNHINQNYNIQTLHASMPINFTTNTEAALLSLKNVLFGDQLSYDFKPHKLNATGKGKGVLIGGNLSILYSLTGTNSQLNTKGKILFIEDLDEYLYHVDRMMMNIDRAGLLNELSGLIIGGMTDMNDNTIPYGKNAKEIILATVKKYNYPVCFDFPAGHLDNNKALIMGAEAILDVSTENCHLAFI